MALDRRILAVGFLFCLTVILPAGIRAASYQVTNNNATGTGSLDWAIASANGNSGPDIITFHPAIAGTSITVHATLNITDGVHIQGGGVEVVGTTVPAPNPVMNVTLGSNGTTISGIAVVNGFIGINVQNSTRHRIYNCRIGTDWSNTSGRAGNIGIMVNSNTRNLWIGDPGQGANVIAGHSQYGIRLQGNPESIFIQNNIIGLASDEDTTLANGYGVYVDTGHGILIGGDRTANEGNVISGNLYYGVYLSSQQSFGNTLCGNIIGLNGAQNAARSNQHGVVLSGTHGHWLGLPATGCGNVIAGNTHYGIWSTATFTYAITIQNNHVGLNSAGSPFPNLTGMYVQNSGGFVIGGNGGSGSLEGNVISGNSQWGMDITGNGNSICGNYIGTNPAGSAAAPNQAGVQISGSGNLIGGSNLSAAIRYGNLISGNSGGGVSFSQGWGNTVSGKFIGLNQAGDAVLANGGMGLTINGATCQDFLVGGFDSSLRNVIAGNSGDAGIWLINGTSGHRVAGNFFGLLADGLAAAPNANYGISGSDAVGCLIGGLEPGAGNLIAERTGVYLTGAGSMGNTIVGNWLGVRSDFGIPTGTFNYGIMLANGAQGNRIGLPAAQPGNLVANYNYSLMMADANTDHNGIYGNTLCAFGVAGVALGAGSNEDKTAPIITFADVAAVSGTAQAGDYIEVFQAENRPAGQGGSLKYLGAVTAGGSGQWSFSLSGQVEAGDYVCALATDSGDNTSGFSNNGYLNAPPTATSTTTASMTPTLTPTASATATATPTATNSPDYTATDSPTITMTSTITPTATISPTFTNTPTLTASPVQTATYTITFSPTATFTPPAEVVDLKGRALLAYPNPADQAVHFVFHLTRPAEVCLEIYNSGGERVARLQSQQPAGDNHDLRWETRGIAQGVYFVRYRVQGREKAKIKVAVVH